MNSAVLANPFGLIDSQDVGLIGLPAERPAQRSLPGSADNLLKSIAETLDRIILDVISRRTADEFAQAEREVFPQYVSLVVAFSRVVAKVIDKKIIGRLNAESFSVLEAEIRENGEACFGERLQERALGTVWMLRKISDLLAILQTAPVLGDDQKEKDAEFAERFFLHALRARFYIDCLIASMRTKQPLYRSVFPQIDDGLRSTIDAYAWVKQAVDLRFPADDSMLIAPEPTADDRELAEASMYDLDHFDAD